MREIIASIDVGSHLIKLIVAEILNNKMNILCALEEESRGVKNGMIVEPVEVEYALKRLLNQAEEKLNTTITKAIVDVPEGETIFKIGEASLTITDEDKEKFIHNSIDFLMNIEKYKINTMIKVKKLAYDVYKTSDDFLILCNILFHFYNNTDHFHFSHFHLMPANGNIIFHKQAAPLYRSISYFLCSISFSGLH